MSLRHPRRFFSSDRDGRVAGDIGETLITTAAGLIIGIPAMIAYYIFRNRLADQIMATVQLATRLTDRLASETGKQTNQSQGRPSGPRLFGGSPQRHGDTKKTRIGATDRALPAGHVSRPDS